jgi:hypothetical protein
MGHDNKPLPPASDIGAAFKVLLISAALTILVIVGWLLNHPYALRYIFASRQH